MSIFLSVGNKKKKKNICVYLSSYLHTLTCVSLSPLQYIHAHTYKHSHQSTRISLEFVREYKRSFVYHDTSLNRIGIRAKIRGRKIKKKKDWILLIFSRIHLLKSTFK